MTNPEHVLERYVADLQKFGTSTDKEEIVLYAARRIKDLEQQLAERQWISVEDRLPQYWGNNIKFIVYIRGGEQQLSWYSSRGWDFYDVTHWMPLPEPPQEQDND